MNQDHCLYCGSSNITEVDEKQSPGQRLHILQCQQCQVMFTELEQRFEADRTQADCAVSSEETTLDKADDLIMDGQYNRALELLARHKYPLEHPLMFIIYRDVCQAAGALENRHILGINKGFDCLPAGEALLDLLANNLRNMEYYLPKDDEEELLYELDCAESAVEVLLCFPFMLVIKSPLPRERRQELIDSILRRRREIMEYLASFLEALPEGQNREYYQHLIKDIRDDLANNSNPKDMDIYDYSDSFADIIKSPLAHKGKASLLFLGVLGITVFAGLCLFHPGCGQWARQTVSSFSIETWICVTAVFVFVTAINIAAANRDKKDSRLRRELYGRLYGDKL